MVAADIARTTELTPEITARWDEELQTAVLACYGECPTSPISIREPEAICEVADIVRDKVTDMLWTVWPACSADGKPVEPRVVDGQAVWLCRSGYHTADRIGELEASGSGRRPLRRR